MNDTDFARASEDNLSRLNRELGQLAEDHDVEILYQAGVLTLEFDEPAPSKIVISPNSPLRQIWISAQSTSFKLDWRGDLGEFVLRSTGETLDALVRRLVDEELGSGC